jgi:peptidyl-prolyl cis-trans isomerase SurA
MIGKRWMLAALAMLFAAGVAGEAAMAQTAIKVIVNNKPITTYDINQRAGLLRLTTGRGGAGVTRQAMEELVNETLKMQEATRAGMRVSKAEVDEAYASLASRVKLSPTRLSQVLRQSGVSPDTLRQRLETEIAWTQILRARFQQEVRIAESDVIAALQKKDDENTEKSMEYRVQAVIFVVPAKSSAGTKAQRRREADQYRSRFSSCNEADALAREFREVVVMPIKTRLETELPQELRKMLDSTPVGKVTTPQTTNNGYEMFALCDKREIASNAAARMEIEDELRNKEGEQLSRRYLRELRRRAIIDYR